MNLSVESISKRFGDKLAVDDVSTELTEGVYGFLGPNGSGKTTLMRMLADVMRPTSGRIRFNQIDIRVLDADYRDQLGYVPQHIGIYKEFSAHKFLSYIASLKGIPARVAQKRIEEVLELVNLTEYRTVKLGKFSGGMRQRIGIAQALLNDPKVLIVDEPTAGLDPKERIRFRNLLSNISNDKIVLLSTHIVSDIEFVAKEVILMKQGRFMGQGTPEQLLKPLIGKVWTVLLPETDVLRFQNQYKVIHQLRKPDGIEVRLLADSKPHHDAVAATPGLEDLYLYHFEEEPWKEANHAVSNLSI